MFSQVLTPITPSLRFILIILPLVQFCSDFSSTFFKQPRETEFSCRTVTAKIEPAPRSILIIKLIKWIQRTIQAYLAWFNTHKKHNI